MTIDWLTDGHPSSLRMKHPFDQRGPDLRARAVSLHTLICIMLRGNHVRTMSREQLASFTEQAGVVLHNMPHAMLSGLHHRELEEINALDPRTEPGGWGPWASELAAGFGMPLPPVGHKAHGEDKERGIE